MITVVSKDFREKIKAVRAGIKRKTAAASGIYLSSNGEFLMLGATDGVRINKVKTRIIDGEGIEPAWVCPLWLESICKYMPRDSSWVYIRSDCNGVTIDVGEYATDCSTLNGDVPKLLLEASK